MYIARIAKIVTVACLALFCLLGIFSSLHDYQTNFLFVKNVMSMGTTFPGNKLMYRAITTPELWHAAFAIVIFGEALAGLLFLVGAYFFFGLGTRLERFSIVRRAGRLRERLSPTSSGSCSSWSLRVGGSSCDSPSHGTVRRLPFASTSP
jgi:hypothetical protein